MNDNPSDIPVFAKTHSSTGEPEPAQVWQEPGGHPPHCFAGITAVLKSF